MALVVGLPLMPAIPVSAQVSGDTPEAKKEQKKDEKKVKEEAEQGVFKGETVVTARKREENVQDVPVVVSVVSGETMEDVAATDISELEVGFVVPRPGYDLSGDALSEFLSDRLAKFKIPRKWEFLKELPRTSYGKAIKGELRKIFEASRFAATEENTSRKDES